GQSGRPRLVGSRRSPRAGYYALRMRVDRRPATSRKADEGESGLLGHAYGETGRARDRCEDRRAKYRRLLDHLEARAAGDDDESRGGIDLRCNGGADQLVQGIVTTNVLPHQLEGAISAGPSGGMDRAARGVQGLLGREGVESGLNRPDREGSALRNRMD